jgi:hypothetical protein
VRLNDITEMVDAYADQAFDAGVADERERIIKLLDDLHLEVGQIAHIANRLSECKTCQAIALIKGEK